MIGFAFYKPYLAVNFAGMHLLCEVLETAALPTVSPFKMMNFVE